MTPPETHPSDRRRAYLINDEERTNILFVLGEWLEYKTEGIDYVDDATAKQATKWAVELIEKSVRKALRAD